MPAEFGPVGCMAPACTRMRREPTDVSHLGAQADKGELSIGLGIFATGHRRHNEVLNDSVILGVSSTLSRYGHQSVDIDHSGTRQSD